MKTYEQMAQHIAAVEKMGRWIALSGMFGCKSEEQGCVIAMDCYLTGMPPLEYERRNSLIMGKPAIPYDAMLAAFHERGGKSRILSRTPDLAEVELEFGGDKQKFSLSWEDAQKESFPYSGKEDEIVAMLAKGEKPPLKSKYATPRSRATMLYARLVSDSIRAMRAEVNFGCYTPEEIEDFSSTDSNVGPSSPAPAPVPSPPAVKPQPEMETAESPQNAEQELAQGSAPSLAGVSEQSLSDPLTDDQRTNILQLMGELKQAGVLDIAERVKSKLVAAGLSKLQDLTVEGGRSLIHALESKQLESWAASQVKASPQ